jgi:hypothetical protein
MLWGRSSSSISITTRGLERGPPIAGKVGSARFAWLIRGMSGFRRSGLGDSIFTAGVRKVRCVGIGVPGLSDTRPLWESEVRAGAVLLRRGRLRCAGLDARLEISWVRRSRRCRIGMVLGGSLASGWGGSRDQDARALLQSALAGYRVGNYRCRVPICRYRGRLYRRTERYDRCTQG